MGAVGVIAVVGACGPERRSYARRLSQATGRTLLPAVRLAGSPDPAQEAALLASWVDPAAGAVVELPHEVPPTDLIGAFVDSDGRTRLRALVCVVDAAHLLDDLLRDDYRPLRDVESGIAAPMVATAQLTVTQIEYASTLALVNWQALSQPDRAVMLALLNHLNPHARLRLRLHESTLERPDPSATYAVEQERPGWVCLLNDDFDPHMTDPRVGALRYEQVRPLHPGRLMRLLDERIEPGEFGTIVRSAGFCRLATRPDVIGQWEQVGHMISLQPLATDAPHHEGDELLAVGQDLAFIGLDLDRDGLCEALDGAALTDAEFLAGPIAWIGLADPFPAWIRADDRSD